MRHHGSVPDRFMLFRNLKAFAVACDRLLFRV
jgi:hypothetical protein